MKKYSLLTGLIFAAATWAQQAGSKTESRDPLTTEQLSRLRDLEARSLQQLTNADVADMLSLHARAAMDDANAPTPPQMVESYGVRGIGQPYRLNAVQSDFTETDCVVFVTRALALALGPDWPTYYKLTQRLRHKEGVIQYRNRNFSTLGDLVPNNSWLLDDVTPLLGPQENRPAQAFTFEVRPKIFEEVPAAPGSKYTRTIFKGSDYKSADKQVKNGWYIPRSRISDVLADLRPGDIALCIRASAGGHMGCTHLGLVARRPDGGVSFLHCAPPATRAIDVQQFLQFYTHVKGFMFLRVKSNAQEIVAAELEARCKDLEVPEATKEDEKNETLRTRRLNAR